MFEEVSCLVILVTLFRGTAMPDNSPAPLRSAAGFGDSILNCRDCDSANRVHPECWPISVPQNDPYFPPVNVSSGRPFCIAFTRSLPGQQTLGEYRLHALTARTADTR